MVIKRSSAGEVDALLADLDADTDVHRESAVARLAVIGSRAVSGLLDVAASDARRRPRASRRSRRSKARDARAHSSAALACLRRPSRGGDARPSASSAASSTSSDGPRVIDRLVALAVDAGAGAAGLRLAALEALADMPEPHGPADLAAAH